MSNEGTSDADENMSDAEPIEVDPDEHEEDLDESEEFLADDIVFVEPTPQVILNPLIEDHAEEEILGSLQFVNNYRERYGQGPTFFEGTLEDAVKASCLAPSAKDRKLLAIYLHNDRSVLANVFCTQTLNNEAIVRRLNDDFVVYGWDLTFESNRNMFLSSLTAHVNEEDISIVRDVEIQHFPIIVVIKKYYTSCEIVDWIYGNVGRDELTESLLEDMETFNDDNMTEIREEVGRLQREEILAEQHEAFQKSLEADRAKELAKQQQESMMASERRRIELEREATEARKEAMRQEAESSLPPEPNYGSPDVTTIRFRTPTGDFIARRFTVDTKLKVLLTFTTAIGFSPDEFKVITSFPRRHLTSIDPELTLQSLKLFPQETVMLEER